MFDRLTQKIQIEILVLDISRSIVEDRFYNSEDDFEQIKLSQEEERVSDRIKKLEYCFYLCKLLGHYEDIVKNRILKFRIEIVNFVLYNHKKDAVRYKKNNAIAYLKEYSKIAPEGEIVTIFEDYYFYQKKVEIAVNNAKKY
jgi:hypothetical protein